MKKKKKRLKYDCNKEYFWSPAFQWKKSLDKLEIGELTYTDSRIEMFPEFYYKAQLGVKPSDLTKYFSGIEEAELEALIIDLVENNILVTSILSPEQLFATQSKLLKTNYTEEDFLDPNEVEKFKNIQQNRSLDFGTDIEIILNQKEEYPSIINQRKSYRQFDTSNKMTMDQLAGLLSIYRQRKEEGKNKYYYASGGALYPIDLYVYIKDNRVENIQGGLYYYNPMTNSLKLVSISCVITEEAHYYTNKEIFNQSAVSIFYIYDAKASMPKYAGMGYHYAIIDTGIMVGALTTVAELNNIGICSIGDMVFSNIKKYFKLKDYQVLLHSVEAGLKK